VSYYQLQQYHQFLREAQIFIQEFGPHALSASLLLQIAEYYQEQKRTDEAIESYNSLIGKYPQSPLVEKALLRLGELYTAAGKPQQALTVYERLLRNGYGPNLKPDALLRQGQAYEAMGDTSAALQRYEQLATQYPDHTLAARGLFHAGRLLLAQQNYQAAQRYFEAVVQQYPTDPWRYDSILQWGITSLQQRQLERAIELFQQAQQAPDTRLAAQAQLQLGHAYALAGDLQQSINAYLRVAYLYPDEEASVGQALQQATRNYAKLKMCAEAFTVYAKLLKRPTSPQETQDLRQELERSGCRETPRQAR
jgi:TolA-binding protein